MSLKSIESILQQSKNNQNTLDVKQHELNLLTTDLAEQFETLLLDFTKEIFTALPNIQTICWKQYEELYSDNYSCRFKMGKVLFLTFIPEEGFFDTYTDCVPPGETVYDNIYNYHKDFTEEENEMNACFSTFLYLNNNLLYELYSDAKIVITRDSINVIELDVDEGDYDD